MINEHDDDTKENSPDDDQELWQYVTKGITPIDRSTAFRPETKRPSKRKANKTPQKAETKSSASDSDFNNALKELENEGFKSERASQKSKQSASAQQTGGFDKRTDERLRRGQIPIEARIDLHGYTKDQAKGVLTTFIRAAYGEGKRCVLVITGKGSRNQTGTLLPTKGVLRLNVPKWLNEDPLSDLIIKHYPAKPKDGGDGAIYVYLKRSKQR